MVLIKVVIALILLLHLLEQGIWSLSIRKWGQGLLQWGFFIGLRLGIRKYGAERAVVETRVEITLRPEIVLLLAHPNGKHVCVIILKCVISGISILMVIKIVVKVINIWTLISEISPYSSSTKIKSLLARYYIWSVGACLGAICGQIVQVKWGSSIWWLYLTIYTVLGSPNYSHSAWWKIASLIKDCS